MPQPIADLHCHPSTKALLGNHPIEKERAWRSYYFAIKYLFKLIPIDEWFGDAVDSQSNLKRVEAGQGNLIFWTLHPIEKPYLEKGPIRNLLTKSDQINTVLVKEYLKDVIKNGRTKTYVKDNIDYHNILVNHEYPLFKTTEKVNQISNTNPQTVANAINLCLCVEGAHAFLTDQDKLRDSDGVDAQEYLKRFNAFVQLLSDDGYRIRYFTLSHIIHNGLFNSAFAGKMITRKELIKFLPRNLASSGINQLGNKILDRCIEEKIHPDLKHMSYRARTTVYAKLEQLQNDGIDFPAPIASHMGVFGGSEDEYINRYLKGKPKLYKFNDFGKQHLLVKCKLKRAYVGTHFDTTFHRKTISLLDEDISRIGKLGGLIGFIIDQRVLGFEGKQKDVDYLTIQDFDWLCKRNGRTIDNFLGTDDYQTLLSEADELTFPKKYQYFKFKNNRKDRSKKAVSDFSRTDHLAQFCYNIMYTLDILKRHPEIANPLRHVCFGSDYDGLVDALNCCKTFADMQRFKDLVIGYLTSYNFEARYGMPADHFIHLFFYQNIVDFFQLGSQPGGPTPSPDIVA